MNNELGIGKWFVVFVVFIIAGTGLLYPEESRICIPGTLDASGSCTTFFPPALLKIIGICSSYYDSAVQCDYVGDKALAEPLLLFGLVGIISLSVLLATPKKVHESWSRLFIYALPILFLLDLLIPARCDSALGLCLDRELGTIFLSSVFFLMSLILIVYKLVQLRRG